MLDVCLLGTGGMMPLPRRKLTSLMTRYNGSNLMIDCGEGTQVAVKEKGWSFKPIDVICFTHYHADHISGLPGLLLTMGNAERTEPLTLIGPKGLTRVVSALRVIAPELPFEIEFRELTQPEETIEIKGRTEPLTLIGPKGLTRVVSALRVIAPELPFEIEFRELTQPEETIEIKGYHITAFRVNHNVTCYGYSLEIKRTGKFDAARAKEQNIPLRCWNPLQKGETVTVDGITYTPDMVLGPARKGIKLTYTTDTRPVKAISEHAAGSDLFICEGMYGEQDKEAKAKAYKHMTFREAASLAKEAGVGEMWLTHYSPSLVRPEEALEEAANIFPNTIAAKDRQSVELQFEEE